MKIPMKLTLHKKRHMFSMQKRDRNQHMLVISPHLI